MFIKIIKNFIKRKGETGQTSPFLLHYHKIMCRIYKDIFHIFILLVDIIIYLI